MRKAILPADTRRCPQAESFPLEPAHGSGYYTCIQSIVAARAGQRPKAAIPVLLCRRPLLQRAFGFLA